MSVAMARVGALGIVMMVAACNDPAIELGRPPPIELSVIQATVRLYGSGAARVLRLAVARLAQGELQAVRAVISTADASKAGAARTRLIEDGIDPAAIVVRAGSDNVIVLTRFTANPTSCNAALTPGWLGDAADSVTSLGQCVQANNLGQMAVDPGDLVSPTPLAPSNGAVAARAVLDWEQGTGRSSAADAGSSNGSGGGASGGTGGTNAVGPTAATGDAPVVGQPAAGTSAANPLLKPSY